MAPSAQTAYALSRQQCCWDFMGVPFLSELEYTISPQTYYSQAFTILGPHPPWCSWAIGAGIVLWIISTLTSPMVCSLHSDQLCPFPAAVERTFLEEDCANNAYAGHGVPRRKLVWGLCPIQRNPYLSICHLSACLPTCLSPMYIILCAFNDYVMYSFDLLIY